MPSLPRRPSSTNHGWRDCNHDFVCETFMEAHSGRDSMEAHARRNSMEENTERLNPTEGPSVPSRGRHRPSSSSWNWVLALVLLWSVIASCLVPTVESVLLDYPTLDVPQFSTNVTFRQDVCDRYKRVARGQVELRDALNGMELRAIIRENQFFKINEETGAIDLDDPGLVAVIMDELARRAGFTWRQTFATAGRPIPGRSFTDLLVWGAEHYDVFCSWWDMTLERLQLGVAFPEGWNDGSYILVGRKDSADGSSENSDSLLSKGKLDLWNWLAPFDTAVWIMTAFTVLATGLLYHRLDHLELNPDIRKVPQPYKLRWTSCYLSFLTFTQHFQFVPRSHATRILTMSLAFWSLLVSATYTANLASFFVVNNSPVFPVETLADAIRAGRSICVFADAAIDGYITREHPSAHLIRKKTELETYQAVRSGECDYVATQYSTWSKFERDKTINSDCNLVKIGQTIQVIKSGFATIADAGTLCTSLIRDVLNVHIVEMNSDGFLDLAWRAYLRREQTVDCALEDALQKLRDDGESQSLGIRAMAGTFVMHWFFVVVALIVAFCTRWYNLRYNNNPEAVRRRSLALTSTLSLPDPARLFPRNTQPSMMTMNVPVSTRYCGSSLSKPSFHSNRGSSITKPSVTFGGTSSNTPSEGFAESEDLEVESDDSEAMDEFRHNRYSLPAHQLQQKAAEARASNMRSCRIIPVPLVPWEEQLDDLRYEQTIQSEKQEEMVEQQRQVIDTQSELLQQQKVLQSQQEAQLEQLKHLTALIQELKEAKQYSSS